MRFDIARTDVHEIHGHSTSVFLVLSNDETRPTPFDAVGMPLLQVSHAGQCPSYPPGILWSATSNPYHHPALGSTSNR